MQESRTHFIWLQTPGYYTPVGQTAQRGQCGCTKCTLHQDTQIPSPEMPTLMQCSFLSVQAQDHTSTGLRTRCAFDMSSEGLQLILVKICILTLALSMNSCHHGLMQKCIICLGIDNLYINIQALVFTLHCNCGASVLRLYHFNH